MTSQRSLLLGSPCLVIHRKEIQKSQWDTFLGMTRSSMVFRLGFHPRHDSSRLKNSGRCSSNPSAVAAASSLLSISATAAAAASFLADLSASSASRLFLDESFLRSPPGIDLERASDRDAVSTRRASSADTLPRVAGSRT
uniref:Uncharacterized protein n=1 Tax=Triticum urartu TaxID=4572 RepID=A0A8R7U836_TRIUA